MKRLPLLDLLCREYPDDERERLFALIMCRKVIVDGGRIANPKELVRVDAQITLADEQFVSRGGKKLEHALSCWKIDVEGKSFIDAGASTGGFSHCLISHGAKRVYSVDVGYNQLSYQLRTDSRIVVMEQTNIMHVNDLDPQPDAAVADLSFRSISGAASHILGQTKERWLIALIKPQFELQQDDPTFDGVIKDDSVISLVLLRVFSQLQEEGIFISKFIASPILGTKGNREYLALLKDTDSDALDLEEFSHIIKALI